jgi:four helix bundle protein
MIKSYKDLDVWKKGIAFAKRAYQITRNFPKEETYGLVSQIRRSAVSIPSNIAEGRSRQHKNEFVQFLYIALGSCAECETQIVVAFELEYLKVEIKKELLEELSQIGKMIRGLVNSLKVHTQ